MQSEDVERGLNETDGLKNEAQDKRQSFAKRLQAVSTDKPPSEKPVGFFAGIMALICCVLPAAACGLCCIIVLALLSNIVPVATIVVGALYYDKENCPAENISLLLVVGGSFALAETLLTTFSKICAGASNEEGEVKKEHPCVTMLHSIFKLASFVWFIAACVIIYRLHPHVNYNKDEADAKDYCNRFLYLFSFWLVTSTFIFLGIAVVLACCSACLVGRSKS